MKILANHIILATGNSCEDARTQVLQFFDKTSLVNYDKIVSRQDGGIPATDPRFAEELERGLGRNREILAGFIEELGASEKQDQVKLTAISQGYQSKVLHIIAHFLDGFIGIDSAFYNLTDESHWLPAARTEAIEKESGRYWLFFLECYSMSPREAALLHM